MRLNKRTKLYKNIHNFFESNKLFYMERNLEIYSYKIYGLDIDEINMNKLSNEILERLPYILYFDDFNDRVPDCVEISYTNENGKKKRKSSNKDWANYINEILKRTTINNEQIDNYYDINGLCKLKNEDIRKGILSDLSRLLNDEIIESWKRLRILGDELGREMELIKIRLNYVPDYTNDRHSFMFEIADSSYQGKERFFKINERSKGFQWYFNFIIKLKYNNKNAVNGKVIYLLDEPGAYLHSTAQVQLIESLKEIAGENAIIYCTHSEHLLNPKYINPASIRVVERNNEKITFCGFSDYKKDKTRGALEPFYNSLQIYMDITKDIIGKNIILTEGMVDYVFLEMIKKQLETLPENIMIIPGHGADNLQDLISWCIGLGNKYIVLLDSDDQGLKAFKNYQKIFGENESKKIINLFTVKSRIDVCTEDLLSDEMKIKLQDTMNISDIKRAIISLYYDNNKRKEFWSGIDNQSQKNIVALSNKILSFF